MSKARENPTLFLRILSQVPWDDMGQTKIAPINLLWLRSWDNNLMSLVSLSGKEMKRDFHLKN